MQIYALFFAIFLTQHLLQVQNELTLWRLKLFVKDALEAQGKNSGKGQSINHEIDQIGVTIPKNINTASKRKPERSKAPAKNAKRRNKKPTS